MTAEQFNGFCQTLPAATYVRQWGGSHVWKVGGKVFAIGSWGDKLSGITFKVSPLSFELLQHQPGLRPAPYLASRGMKWIQCFAEPGLTPSELQAYLRHSYETVGQGLSKTKRISLGLN